MADQPQSKRDYYPLILCSLMAVAVLYLWVLPLWNGFWLDECAIFYVIHAGFGQIIPRCFISLQSFAFSMLEWVPLALGGTSGPAFRLPCLAAGLITLLVLNRLGREVSGPSFGLTMAALYISLPEVAAGIPNARPYAIAMLAEGLGLLCFFRWLKSGQLQHGLAWIVCGVVAGYFHYLFLVPVALEGLYAVKIFANRSRAQFLQVGICAAAGALLLLPLAPQLQEMAQQSRWLSSRSEPRWINLLLIGIPGFWILTVILIGGIEWLAGSKVRWRPPTCNADVPKVGSLLLIVPTVFYFAVSRLTLTNLFLSRYLLPSLVGGILLWAWLIEGFESQRVRQGVVLTGVIFGMLLAASTARVPGFVLNYSGQDWSAAARTLPETGRYLIYPGLAETARLPWLQEPKRQEYFASPVALFRPDISSENSDIVPFQLGAAEKKHMQAIVRRLVAQRIQVSFIGWRLPNAVEWQEWLSGELGQSGFSKTSDRLQGVLLVTVWSPPK